MHLLALTFLAIFTPVVNAETNACPPDEEYAERSWDWNDCFGAVTYYGGEVYRGWWKNGVQHGYGTFDFGTEGEWAGQKYEGFWKNDKQHGQGTITMPRGKYEGEWKNGKEHGLGIYTPQDGVSFSGYFMNGKYVPDICVDMSLSKGSSEHAQCVLKLMDSVMSEED